MTPFVKQRILYCIAVVEEHIYNGWPGYCEDIGGSAQRSYGTTETLGVILF